MSQISSIVNAVANILRGEGGLQSNIMALAAQELTPPITLSSAQLMTQNVPADIAERSTVSKYPNVHVYCDKVENTLREKFRTFSGNAEMVVEVRVSADRLEGVDAHINLMVDGVTATLNQNRGDWDGGMFYGGGYSISFSGVKHGGKNFIQSAKVAFTVNISSN